MKVFLDGKLVPKGVLRISKDARRKSVLVSDGNEIPVWVYIGGASKKGKNALDGFELVYNCERKRKRARSSTGRASR